MFTGVGLFSRMSHRPPPIVNFDNSPIFLQKLGHISVDICDELSIKTAPHFHFKIQFIFDSMDLVNSVRNFFNLVLFRTEIASEQRFIFSSLHLTIWAVSNHAQATSFDGAT